MYLSKLRQISKQPANLLIDNIRKAAHEQERCNPLTLYKTIVERGCLKPDDHQLEAVERLDELFHTIEKQARPIQAKVSNSKEQKKEGFFSRLFKPSDKAVRQSDLVYALETKDMHDMEADKISDPSIAGMYIYGDVGCGKTMLMDLFYECLDRNNRVGGVKRLHFNKFMVDCHKRLHRIKQNAPPRNAKDVYKPFDVIPPLAEELVRESWILCFDEFQVTDIADAMIIRRLFTELWKRGMILITTGNRKQTDLYSQEVANMKKKNI